jgi:ABC-type branched-subunit amino acid transport system substrate-binding protein
MTVTAAAGCGEDGSGEGTISIGTIISQTGTLGGLGQDQVQGIQLAVDEINAAGGVAGKRLTLFNRDDKSTEEGSMEAARALVALKVPAVIGAVASRLTLASGAITSAAGIVQISAGSTSPLITASHATTTPLLFRTCPSDALQGKLLAKRARARAFDRAGVIHVPGAYGQGMAQVFASEFKALGGQVTDLVEYVEGQQSYVEVLGRILDQNPRVLLVIGYGDDTAQMVKDYNSNFTSKQAFFYFTDAVMLQSFITLAGGGNSFRFQHEGTGPAAPATPEYERYSQAFKRKYDAQSNPGVFTQNAYDALYLIAAAIEANDGPEGLIARLPGVSSGGTKFGPGQWREMKEAIRAGMDVDYHGASGDADMDANGDVVAP